MRIRKKLILFRTTIFILTLLLIGFAYHSYTAYQEKQKDEAFFENEKKLFLNELSEMTTRYDSSKLETALKKEEIVAYQEKIKSLEVKIRTEKGNGTSLLSYRKEIDLLKLERDRLFRIADSLKTENDSLIEERNLVKNKLREKEHIASKLAKENDDYEKAIKKASALQASGFKAHGIKFRSSGSISETERALRVQSIRVNFEIAENIFAKSGDKDIYVQIMDPKSNIIGEKISTKFPSGLKLDYSSKETIPYDKNDRQNISIFVDIEKSKPILKGTYFVMVFHDDKKLGSTDFTLK